MSKILMCNVKMNVWVCKIERFWRLNNLLLNDISFVVKYE